MSTHSTLSRAVAAAVLAAALGGCFNRPAGPRPSAAAQASCRSQVDRVYAAQNRGDLTFRDQRDEPFNNSYFPGDTPRGLGAEFSRDNDYSACLANSPGGAAEPGAAPPSSNIGPVFTPAPTSITR